MKYEITKGSEKDFELAPEWAMVIPKHINNRRCVFAESQSQGAKRTEMYGDGECVIVSPNEYEITAERRPITEPVWDGEGLPPVGALCRYRAFSDMPWVECKVLAWHDDEVWLKRTEEGKTFTLGNPDLFPIPSPEDVAREKERSEECDKIFGILSCVERTGNRSDMAEALYDAGYRKME